MFLWAQESKSRFSAMSSGCLDPGRAFPRNFPIFSSPGGVCIMSKHTRPWPSGDPGASLKELPPGCREPTQAPHASSPHRAGVPPCLRACETPLGIGLEVSPPDGTYHIYPHGLLPQTRACTQRLLSPPSLGEWQGDRPGGTNASTTSRRFLLRAC